MPNFLHLHDFQFHLLNTRFALQMASSQQFEGHAPFKDLTNTNSLCKLDKLLVTLEFNTLQLHTCFCFSLLGGFTNRKLEDECNGEM